MISWYNQNPWLSTLFADLQKVDSSPHKTKATDNNSANKIMYPGSHKVD